MIVTYALTGSLRRVTPSGNVTSSNGSRSTTGPPLPPRACSTSIGSRRIAWVPTMTSATPGERFRIAAPSCCATQPATATIGSWPCSAASCAQLAEPRVELVLGALADAARVDDDDVGVGGLVGRLVAGLLEQAGHPLGVVHVHLAAERFDQVFTRHVPTTFAFRLSLSPVRDFRFRAFAFRRFACAPPGAVARASISRAEARRPSVTASPPSIRASSSTRPSPSSRRDRRPRAPAVDPLLDLRSGCRRTRQSAAGA